MFPREKPSSDQRFRSLTWKKNILHIYYRILNKITANGNRFIWFWNNSQQIPYKPQRKKLKYISWQIEYLYPEPRYNTTFFVTRNTKVCNNKFHTFLLVLPLGKGRNWTYIKRSKDVHNVNWTYLRRTRGTQDIFWTSYVCSVYVQYLRGFKN